MKIDGLIDTSANCQLRLINSYIICKNYKGIKTNRIIETDYIDNCKVSNLKYLKKIKGNPNIEIIDKKGSIVLKGFEEDISNSTIVTGIYDIRSKDNFYESNVLLAGN